MMPDIGRRGFLAALGLGCSAPASLYAWLRDCGPPTTTVAVEIVSPSVDVVPTRWRHWAGLAANGKWDDPLNWVGGLAPSDGDSVVFPAGSRGRLPGTDDRTLTLNTLVIEDGAEVVIGDADEPSWATENLFDFRPLPASSARETSEPTRR